MKLPPEEIEKRIARALRDLPDRCAPITLEARVLAEIRRRTELPWWRQSHAHWPAIVRGAFFVLSMAVAAMSIAGFFALTRTLEGAQVAAAMQRLGWIELLRTTAASMSQLANAVFHAIPPLWIYGTLTVFIACYATVIGVGAAAYRALSTKV